MKTITVPILMITLMLGLMATGSSAKAGDEVKDTDWYFGGGFGTGGGKDFANNVRRLAESSPPGTYTQFNEGGGAGKFFFGYHSSKNMALEGFWNISGGYGGNVGSYHENIEVQGFGLAVVGMMPLGSSGKWWGVGKAGLYRWKVKNEFEVGSVEFEVADRGIAPMIGAGVRYGRYKDVTMRWEIEYYPNVGKKDTTGQSDIVMIFFPLSFAFGF